MQDVKQCNDSITTKLKVKVDFCYSRLSLLLIWWGRQLKQRDKYSSKWTKPETNSNLKGIMQTHTHKTRSPLCPLDYYYVCSDMNSRVFDFFSIIKTRILRLKCDTSVHVNSHTPAATCSSSIWVLFISGKCLPITNCDRSERYFFSSASYHYDLWDSSSMLLPLFSLFLEKNPSHCRGMLLCGRILKQRYLNLTLKLH